MKLNLDDINIDSSQPLQTQLYKELSQRILKKRYLPGYQLPSTRQLAVDLQISRNTVTSVYDQLKVEGFLESVPGKGIFVHREMGNSGWLGLTEEFLPDIALDSSMVSLMPEPQTKTELIKRHSSNKDHNLPFSPGLPDIQNFPIKVWNRIQHQQEGRLPLLGYNDTQGFQPLREAIASYLKASRGVHCKPHQIIVTNGAQQALSLIADVFLSPGDKVAYENPGYRRARYALLQRGAQLVPVPLSNQVMDIQSLPGKAGVKLIYCTPTHQYPMGGILSISQRMALLNWARTNKTWIIEDDYDSEFHFYNKPIAAMQGMAQASPVLYVGSFSKTLFPALRLGYLVLPEHLVDAFLCVKQIQCGDTPLLSQAVTAEFMESGQFVRHVRHMRQIYKHKWNTFQKLVKQHLTKWVTPIAESAGMHLVLTGDFDDTLLCQYLATQGFGSAPVSDHCITEHKIKGLVLGFSSASESQMECCVEAIGNWFNDCNG